MASWDKLESPTSHSDATRAIAEWRKSSHSSDGACVEVAFVPGEIMVRDSKNRDGATLTFTAREWKAFIAGVRSGEFELP
jgi:predicted secreted Zn-dependent protease